MKFDPPLDGAVVDDDGAMQIPWRQWVSLVTESSNASRSNGPTSNRPISGVWVGQDYFDTTLGKKVTAKTVSGLSIVWVDGAGKAV